LRTLVVALPDKCQSAESSHQATKPPMELHNGEPDILL
jgi:hypothetical protein